MSIDEVKRKFPSTPLLGVGALVIRNREVLLVKRGYPPGKGLWSIPGGLVNVGEKLDEAVLRELYEETGVKGSDPKLLAITEIIIWSSNRVKYHYIVLDFLVKPLTRDVIAGGDVVEARFFDIREALRSLKLTPGTKKLLGYVVSVEDIWSIPSPLLISITRTE